MITLEASLQWAGSLETKTMKSRLKTKVLVLPVFRRYWLWHAWTDQAAEAAAASKAIPNWREGVGLEEKLQLLGTSLTQRVRLLTEPAEDLQAASQAASVRGPLSGA